MTARLVLALVALASLLAQEIAVKGSLGSKSFLDDSRDLHLLAGGSAQFYLTRRFSVEPEFLFLYQSPSHHDLVFLPDVAWDFRSQGRVRPYVVGGVGWLRYVQKFDRSPGFTTDSWIASVGFGTKVYLNSRWFIAPEFRTGWGPHARLSAAVGYVLKR